MNKTNRFARIPVLSLTLALSLPNPAFALRQRAPSVDTPVHAGLEEALRGSSAARAQKRSFQKVSHRESAGLEEPVLEVPMGAHVRLRVEERCEVILNPIREHRNRGGGRGSGGPTLYISTGDPVGIIRLGQIEPTEDGQRGSDELAKFLEDRVAGAQKPPSVNSFGELSGFPLYIHRGNTVLLVSVRAMRELLEAHEREIPLTADAIRHASVVVRVSPVDRRDQEVRLTVSLGSLESMGQSTAVQVNGRLLGQGDFQPLADEARISVRSSAAGMEEKNQAGSGRNFFERLGRRLLGIAKNLAGSPIGESGQRVLAGHSFFVRSVAYSPDGTRIVSGGEDRTVRLWDVASGRELWWFQTSSDQPAHEKGVIAVAFHPRREVVAAWLADGTLLLIDSKGGTLISERHFPQRRGAMVFSPDGEAIITGGSEGLQIWLLQGDAPVKLISNIGEVTALAVSQEGTIAVAVGFGSPVAIQVYNSAGDPLRTFNKNAQGQQLEKSLDALAFGPDGSLFSGDGAGIVLRWDVESQTGNPGVVSLGMGQGHGVRSLAVSPDGKRLAEGGLFKTVRLLPLVSGQSTTEMEGHTGIVYSVAFSPDGKFLASSAGRRKDKPTPGPADNTIRLWDVAVTPASGLEEGREIPFHYDVVEAVGTGDPVQHSIPPFQVSELSLVQRIWRSDRRFFMEFLPQVQKADRTINAVIVYPPDSDRPFRVALSDAEGRLSKALEMALSMLERVDARTRHLATLETQVAAYRAQDGTRGGALLLRAARLHFQSDAAGMEERRVLFATPHPGDLVILRVQMRRWKETGGPSIELLEAGSLGEVLEKLRGRVDLILLADGLGPERGDFSRTEDTLQFVRREFQPGMTPPIVFITRNLRDGALSREILAELQTSTPIREVVEMSDLGNLSDLSKVTALLKRHLPAAGLEEQGVMVEDFFVPQAGVEANWYTGGGLVPSSLLDLLDSEKDRILVPLADIPSGTTVFVQERNGAPVISRRVIAALELAGVEIERFTADAVPQSRPDRENVYLLDVKIGSEREWVLDPAAVIINFRSAAADSRPNSPEELGALINVAREADRRVFSVRTIYRSDWHAAVIAVNTQL